MGKKVINNLLSIFIVLIVIYLIYSIIEPVFYNKEIVKQNYDKITDEESLIVDSCVKTYLEYCINNNQKEIKGMIPFINKFNMNKYTNLSQMYKEKEIESLDQCIVSGIKKINNSIYQVKVQSRSGNVVEGIIKNTIIIKLKKMGHSFKVYYDMNLNEEGV